MPSEISVLLGIQELDQRIRKLTREIDNLPKHVASIKARLAAHRQALERTQAILAENGKERRHLESKVGDHRQKIAKLQDQMDGARTNEQFRAFQHEIQFCKDAIDQFEERILENMEQAESLQSNVSQAAADLKWRRPKSPGMSQWLPSESKQTSRSAPGSNWIGIPRLGKSRPRPCRCMSAFARREAQPWHR